MKHQSQLEAAVFEAHKNRNACFTNLKNDNIKHFTMRFISRKKQSWTIGGLENLKFTSNERIYYDETCKQVKVIDNKHKKHGFSMYPTYNFGEAYVNEPIPSTTHNCGIHFDGIYYFLLVPFEVNQKNIKERNSIVSMDPGVRSFNTCYDFDNETNFKIGEGSAENIYKNDLSILDSLINH